MRIPLGCFVKAMGGSPLAVKCEGKITDCYLNGGNLFITTETSWNEMREVRHLIESSYPGMKIYFLSEEYSMGFFQTNDINHVIFSERYFIDLPDVSYYASSLEEMADRLYQETGQDIPSDSLEAITKAVDEYKKKQTESGKHFDYFIFTVKEVKD